MSLPSTSIAKNVRNELENLIDLVMSDEHEQQSAYQVERNIWKGILVNLHNKRRSEVNSGT